MEAVRACSGLLARESTAWGRMKLTLGPSLVVMNLKSRSEASRGEVLSARERRQDRKQVRQKGGGGGNQDRTMREAGTYSRCEEKTTGRASQGSRDVDQTMA